MRMKRAIIIPVLFLQIAAFAQDLNPTVTVTNTYEGEASGIVKPAQVLSIPDSVSRFTLNFDYSVFESPYMGSYEFKPYSVQLRPRNDFERDGLLYVKAGAGYTLHPDLHVVYTPISRPKMALSLFADHESYIGNYWNFKLDGTDNGFAIKRDPSNRTTQGGRVGNSDLGARLRYSWGSGELNTMTAWENLFSAIDRGGKFGHLANIFDFQTSVKSIESPLDYDAVLSVRTGADKYRYVTATGINATEVNFNGSIGTIRVGLNNLSIGADVAMQFLRGDADAYSGFFAFIPRDEFWLGDWHFDVGFRLSALFSGDDTATPLLGETTHQAMFTRQGQWIYPRVLVTKSLAGGRYFFDAGVTGGEKYGSYLDFVKEHPFLSSRSVVGPYLDNTIEKLNIFAGIRGSITDRLEFRLKGGYRMVDNELMWKVEDGGVSMIVDRRPHLGYCSYNQAYSALDMEWLRDPFSAKVGVEAAYSWLRSDGTYFAPPVLRGKSEFKYHWGDRIRAGIRGDWQTSRKAEMVGEVKIPGWCDLGLFGEFQWRRDLGFWLEAGNLLNMTIMTDPFIAQRGISVTAGVIFKL